MEDEKNPAPVAHVVEFDPVKIARNLGAEEISAPRDFRRGVSYAAETIALEIEEAMREADVAVSANNVEARAEVLAGQIWAYFDRTGGATATRWFKENKSLAGPAHIIELCRKAMTPPPQTKLRGTQE